MRWLGPCLTLCVVGSTACRPSAPPPPHLLAAASAAALAEGWLAPRLVDADWRISIGSSSVLSRQIEAGAPADVLLCANRAWVEWLTERERVEGEPVLLATNRVVYVTAPGDGTRPDTVDDLLAGAGDRRIAVGSPGVPVGDLVRTSLADTWAEIEPIAVGFPDARSVLRAVSSGEVAGGFVYRSDALGAGLDVAFELSGENELMACRIAGGEHGEASDALFELLEGADARHELTRLGFSVSDQVSSR